MDSRFDVLDALIEQRDQLDKKIREIIADIKRSSERQATSTAQNAASSMKPAQRRSRMTPAGRKRLVAALKRRWAEKKQGKAARKQAPAKKPSAHKAVTKAPATKATA